MGAPQLQRSPGKEGAPCLGGVWSCSGCRCRPCSHSATHPEPCALQRGSPRGELNFSGSMNEAHASALFPQNSGYRSTAQGSAMGPPGLTGHLRPTGSSKPSSRSWQRWCKVPTAAWSRRAGGSGDLQFGFCFTNGPVGGNPPGAQEPWAATAAGICPHPPARDTLCVESAPGGRRV